MIRISVKWLGEAYRGVGPFGASAGGAAVLACVAAAMGQLELALAAAGLTMAMSMALVAKLCRAVAALRRQCAGAMDGAQQAEEHYIGVLKQIIRYVDSRENYTRGRSERIGNLCESISQKMGMEAATCSQMNLAGQLHDVGLLAVSERILNKRALLGSKEFQAVQKHAEVSCELLSPMDSLGGVLPAIRHHHERMNGTGYPHGLSGTNIPLEARILAVADSYDAMTHDRPHRSAMSPAEAMAELRRCTPAGYDTQTVDALAAVLRLPELSRPVMRETTAQTTSA